MPNRTEAEIEAADYRCTEAVDVHSYDDIRLILIKVVTAIEFGVLDNDDGNDTCAVIWDILKDACLTFIACKTCGARTAEDEVCEDCKDKAE